MLNQILDIGNILSRPVVGADPQPLFSLEPGEPIIESATFDEPEPTPEPAPGVQQPREPFDPEAEGYMPPLAIAETVVNLLDGLQSSVIPWLREKKIFTERELEIIQSLDTTGNTIYQTNSPDAAVMAKLIKHKAIVAKIPFDDGEKRRLIEATARYAETTQLKVSPLTGLMMAYSEVTLKRAAYFFNE